MSVQYYSIALINVWLIGIKSLQTPTSKKSINVDPKVLPRKIYMGMKLEIKRGKSISFLYKLTDV